MAAVTVDHEIVKLELLGRDVLSQFCANDFLYQRCEQLLDASTMNMYHFFQRF